MSTVLEMTGSGMAITNLQRNKSYWYNLKTRHVLDLEKPKPVSVLLSGTTKGAQRSEFPVVTNKRTLESIRKWARKSNKELREEGFDVSPHPVLTDGIDIPKETRAVKNRKRVNEMPPHQRKAVMAKMRRRG